MLEHNFGGLCNNYTVLYNSSVPRSLMERITNYVYNDDIVSMYHRQQNKCYPKGVRLSEKLQLTAVLCNEI